MLSLPLAPAIPKYPPILASDFKCLVDNVYHEARGESFFGQILVARTTLNRGEQICKVVYAHKQFSWTTKPAKVKDQNAYQIAYAAAIEAVTYQAPVYYFHNKNIKPSWAKFKTPIIKEGNHVFYHSV